MKTPVSLDLLRQDFAYAWRSMRRARGFSAAVIVTLAIGIGVNSVMFTVLDRLFLRQPPGVRDASELRRFWMPFTNSQGERTYTQSLSYPVYRAIQGAVGAGAELALYNTYNTLTLGRDRGGPPVHGVYSTSNYFRVLGVRPAFGRFFTADEDRMGAGVDVAVISHPFWISRMAGDSAVLGKRIALGTRSYTVIGVAEQSFIGLDVQAVDAWMPLAALPRVIHLPDGRLRGPWWETADSPSTLRVVARLAPGFSDAELAARASVAGKRVYEQWKLRQNSEVLLGSINEARGPRALRTEAVIGTRLGGVAMMVFLIACANVINLLLARATYRRREIAVRLALGMSRLRLVRLLTLETLLLALVAGTTAVMLAWWGGEIIRALLLPDIEWVDSALDWRVVVFTLSLAACAGLIAGIIPAVQASKPQLSNALQAGGRQAGARRTRLSSTLVVAQAALSVVLLVGAMLFVRSLRNVRAVDIGFEFDNVIHGSVQFWQGEAPADAALAQAMNEVARSLESAPAVASVATSMFRPMTGGALIKYYAGADSIFRFREDGPSVATVSPRFFETVGLRFRRGTSFSSDGPMPPREVVVNEAMAERAWQRQEPLGKCMRFGSPSGECYTVVGVVENARRSSILEEVTAQYYLPFGVYDDMSLLGTSILVRAHPGATDNASNLLRTAIRDAFPAGYPVVESMAATLDPQYRPWRLGATLFSAFGLLALLVAVVGVFSTVSYDVSRRTHEFGVRMALGARMQNVLSLVIGQCLAIVGFGVVVGVGLALASGTLVERLLYGIEPSDPGVVVGVSLTLLLAAGLAATFPAWRAARVDPVTALRAD